MTLQAVHAGNQSLYVGNEGRLAFTIRHRSTGCAADLTETGLNLSRTVFHMAGRTVDSDVYPAAFDWMANGAGGEIAIDLTGFDFPSGSFGARLVLYCLAYPNGFVAADGYPINVGRALAGTIPGQSDVNTLFAVLANDAAGQGSDRVAWVGQTMDTTVTEGLNNLKTRLETTETEIVSGRGGEASLAARIIFIEGESTKIKVSSDDTTPGYCNGKLVAGDGIIFTENNNGGDETLILAAAVASVASKTEQETATDITKAVTPGRQQHHPSAAKGWVRFNGSGTLAILANYNVTSITDNGIGDYTVNFLNAFSNANYSAVGFADPAIASNQTPRQINIYCQTASTLRITSITASVTYEDAEYISVVAFGDQ